ncbi:GNAT family N-acetyltransferase [Alicyclobacillus fastidiosus]|uniref:GNAT family N-acetyltransferase n=1 Tax=Alicyclobacillus fastidiosus TaxID=392011 RepID=A0ABY6ZLW0_9BACL|nr:GNAT family N-acetyltransferase [Alicyclobacillus fastidiosus]WAH43879.1 GNAT family N-acetyltransferase [Alicyclobacillus fastidiosus]GMA60120.1 N-acetyltransferase [Alicyclobacillus fastidiosus]
MAHETIVVRRLRESEPAPTELLLLADPSADMIDSYLPRCVVYVAEHLDAGVVGVCAVLPTRPGVVEIVNVAVDEAWQRQGVASGLLREVIALAKETPAVGRLEIATGNSSFTQLRLYQRLGFRMTHIEQDYFVKHYPQPIYEDGLQCRDLVHLAMDIPTG